MKTAVEKVKKVRMVDIASEVGVTRSAVSAVLSGRKSTVNVSPATSERILMAARKLNFKPNILGRSLAAQRSFSLAFLCKKNISYKIPDIMEGIQDFTYDQDYSLLTYYHGESVENEATHIRRCQERMADGLIVVPAIEPGGQTNAKRFAELQKSNVPVVQLLNQLLLGIPCVRTDGVAATELAFEHLAGLGHRRIAYVAHEAYDDNRIPGFFGDMGLRVESYRHAMESIGMEPTIFTHPVPAREHDYMRYSEELVPQIMAHPWHPTAILAGCDHAAIGLLRGFIKNGIRVPEDISVIGFNNIEAAKVIVPALTTLQPPLKEIGYEAARSIFALLAGKPVENKLLKSKLIVRESTGSPRPG